MQYQPVMGFVEPALAQPVPLSYPQPNAAIQQPPPPHRSTEKYALEVDLPSGFVPRLSFWARAVARAEIR